MTETCDVSGCTEEAIAELTGTDNGLRCRDCLGIDLGMRSV